MKICSVCKETKSFESFYNFKLGRDGKCSRCKVCDDAARYKYRLNNIEKVKILERNRSLKFKYGITSDDYNQMLSNQDGCCAICKSTETRGAHSFSVDHNHSTGNVRGLLCNNCNRALGMFGDSIPNIENALNYLRKYDIH